MKEIYDVLVSWYEENKRDLPWRKQKDPYCIWVSEIMLQQTRVEAVLPYYKRFIEAFPNIKSLSEASDDVLNKYWEGLGYYSRIRNMKQAAIQMMENFDGKFPNNYEDILSLKGIGPYTAGAIASIAYNQSVCAIDGNVLRVYARLYALEEDISKTKTKATIQSLIEQDKGIDMASFNQGLMDLGATICIPNARPRCNICPLMNICKAYEQGKENRLPMKQKQKKRRKEKYTVLLYVFDHKVLIHKRKSEGLLANLYEFVLEEGHLTKKDTNGKYLGKYNHIFSHVEWNMKGFLIETKESIVKEGYMYVDIDELETTYSIPTAFHYFKNQIL